MAGRATFTTVISRKTAPDPRTAAATAHRPAGVPRRRGAGPEWLGEGGELMRWAFNAGRGAPAKLAHKGELCYKLPMDTTIRNVDGTAYRRLKARAALEGKTMGEILTEAIQAYLARPGPAQKRRSLRDLRPEPYPEGTERLSLEIDEIVYGG